MAESFPAGAFLPPDGPPIPVLPAFCRVAATLTPTPDSDIKIELWMPEAGWNGRFLGTGNGGFAGKIVYGALAGGLKLGYAVANTDMGTSSAAPQDASGLIGRPERWADWGYRATHEMTVVSKRIVADYYGQKPKHAYFSGCSTGGEQALMEAQRFPDDYEGIAAGAAANNRTRVHTSILWNFLATQRTPGAYIPPAKLTLIENAALAKCDAIDGVKDGLIGDPRQCAFDPATLECRGADNEGCLTPAQVETARRIYSGPVNPRTGQRIYPGTPRGSEFGWSRFGPAPQVSAVPLFAGFFKIVFGPNWEWRTFDYDGGLAKLEDTVARAVNATSPDLGRFRAQGHKLISYHGWADWLVVPEEAINYYNAVRAWNQRTPGRQDVGDFYRLFMAPGMGHCLGGPGPNNFDALGAVVDWVEHGRAPNKLIATKYVDDNKTAGIAMQRPLCPYPQVARYKGTGSMKDAANFVCVN